MAPREAYDTIPSTQDRAIELARGGAPEGTVIVAASQSEGRGRYSHRWASPQGGLYLSVILPGVPEVGPLLSVGLGLELAKRLERFAASHLSVRWPNDVVVDRPHRPPMKVAGVLVDQVACREGGMKTVAGFGVNVATDLTKFPRELYGRVTTLEALSGVAPALVDVENEVVAGAIALVYQISSPAGRKVILEEASARLYGIGREGLVDGRSAGRIRGLADDGSLELMDMGRAVRVTSGEVVVGAA